jgi:beta-hydroxylase
MGVAFADQLRQSRRKYVKRAGKRTIRALADFIGRQSLVGDRPVLDTEFFPSLAAMEADWRLIRAELDQVLKDREQLAPLQKISPDQMNIAKGDSWKAFMFYGFGWRSERNCRRCPETARLLESVPGLQSAWYSILAPGYHVPPHRGITKGIIRVHLGLIVPDDRENCYMRVGDETLHWEEGKCFVFDDTYKHEVLNNTDQERVVLLFDMDRPMRLPGRLVGQSFVWGIKRTGYFKDAKRNQAAWEDSLAETMEQNLRDDSQAN